MIPNNSPLILQLRVDWSEQDIYGHINNVQIMKYLQAARVNFWEKSGLAASYEDFRIGPMLVSTHCDFKKNILYPGIISVYTGCSFTKNTSFGLIHHIANKAGDICAIGNDVSVVFDFNAFTKVPIPDWLMKNIKPLRSSVG